MKTTTAKFKPIVLFYDEDRAMQTIKSFNEQAETISEAITDLFEVLSQFGDVNLSDSEIESYLKQGKSSILDNFRKHFPHPKATDHINLELLGIAKTSTKAIDISKSFIDKFAIEDGKPILKQRFKDLAIENNKVYSENEKQNQAFKIAETMLKLSNEALESGFIGKYEYNVMINKNPFINNSMATPKPRVNHFKIKDIR